MKIIPEEHYGQDYFYEGDPTRGKEYRDKDGTIKHYIGPSSKWHGFGYVAEQLQRLFPKDIFAYDIGCGCGNLIEYLYKYGLMAYGSDISKFAIEKGISELAVFMGQQALAGRLIQLPADWILQCLDITDPEFLNKMSCSRRQFDLVIATDLLEHIYYNKLGIALQNMAALGKHFFFDVSTAANPSEVFVHREGEEVPLEREWQAVAGHVTVLQHNTWLDILSRVGIRPMLDKMKKFEQWRVGHPEMQKMVAWDAKHIIIGKKTK